MTEETQRLAPLKKTLNRLFALSGNRCAFPGCSHELIDEEACFVGQVCHIEGAMPGGERFNPEMTNEERRGFENLLLMCYAHHIRTDNVDKFPVERLREIKAGHELRFRAPADHYRVDEQVINTIYEDQLAAIKRDTMAIRQQGVQLLDKSEQQLDLQRQLLAAVTEMSARLPEGGTADLNQEITDIMRYREGHQHRLALQRYETFKTRHWARLTAREKYRVLVNMGVIHLELFENEPAGRYLTEGGAYQPEDIRAMNYTALGHTLLAGRETAEKILAEILRREPENIQAWATILELRRELSWEDLLASVPVAVRQTSQVAFMLSKAAVSRGRYENAVTWAQVALEAGDGDDCDLKGNLASVILGAIHEPFIIATGQVNRDTINKATYVVKLLDEAWAALQGTELAASRHWFLRNRGVAKRMLGDPAGCLADLKLAASLQPGYEVYRESAITAVELSLHADAWSLAELAEPLAGDAEQREDIALLKTEIRSISSDWPDAISRLKQLLTWAEGERTQTHAQELLVKLLIRTGQQDEADRQLDALINQFPHRISPYVYRSRRHREKGDLEGLLTDLDRAYLNVPQATSQEDVRELAMALADANAFVKAIELMEGLTDTSVLSRLSEDLVRLYHAGGQTKKLFELCQKLIRDFGPNLTLTEFLVATYQHLNDTAGAIRACEEYLAVYPDDQRLITRLLQIHFQQNNWQAIRSWLAKVAAIDQQLPMSAQYRLAVLFFLTGEKERAYNAAYEIRKHFISELKAHEQFFGLFMGFGPVVEHPEDPEVAAIGSAVMLSRGEENQTWVICAPDTRVLLADECLADTVTAIALLGKRTGDTADLDGTGLSFTITRIEHRYNHAYRQVLKLLGEGDSPAFRKIPIGDTGDPQLDLQPLFEMMGEQVAYQRQVAAYLHTGHFTIGALAAQRHTNPVKVWSGLTSFDTPGILIANGPEEFHTALQGLAAGRGLFFDLISLVTVAQLDLLDLLAGLPHKLAVSQSTLDELNELIRETDTSRAGSNSLVPQGDGFAYQQLSAADMAGQKARLNRLHDWITQHCDVLPCLEALELDWAEKVRLNELIGESFTDTLLTASAKGYLLFAEEWSVRSLAYEEHQADGCYTLVLLHHLRVTGTITPRRYAELTLELICLNYRRVPADSIVVFEALSRFRDIRHPVLIRALGGIHSDLFGQDNSLTIAVNVIFKAVLTDLFEEIYTTEAAEYRAKFIFMVLDLIRQLYTPLAAVQNNLHLIARHIAPKYPGGLPEVERYMREFFEQTGTAGS